MTEQDYRIGHKAPHSNPDAFIYKPQNNDLYDPWSIQIFAKDLGKEANGFCHQLLILQIFSKRGNRLFFV